MQAQVVLIVDPREELSQKYKKIIQQDCYVHAVIYHDLQEALDNISDIEPDLVILSDNFDENINDLCVKFREFSNTYRFVLVALSKSSYLDDKLAALKAGADDYISEPIDLSEFSARIFAHLRRHVEELSSPVTRLPLANMTYKVLNRTLKSGAYGH
ncbi:MAG: response regulator [Desulfosudis oleivorans]|nr:response regulator [Desulfosudis oleivorans]